MTYRFWFGLNQHTFYYRTTIFTAQYVIKELKEIDSKETLFREANAYQLKESNTVELYYTRYIGLDERMDNNFTTIYQCESRDLSF
jgi:hypothetical protein